MELEKERNIKKYWWAIAVTAGLGLVGWWIASSNQKQQTFLSPVVEVINKVGKKFSLEEAPSESLRGKIATMSGEIKWQSRTATEAADLKEPITIQQGESLITGENSSVELNFDKAAIIELKEKSELNITQTLPVNLVFWQKSGIGTYTKKGDYPLSVRAKSLLIDNGGKIKVTIDEEDPIVTVRVLSGKITMAFNSKDYVSQKMELKAGEMWLFNDDTRQGEIE